MSIHRLYRLYELATEAERESGRTWYDIARADIALLALRHQTNTKTVAGIVAALSPNTRWDTNLVDADHVLSVALVPFSLADYHECKVSTYNANKAKAFSIAEFGPHDALLRCLAVGRRLGRTRIPTFGVRP